MDMLGVAWSPDALRAKLAQMQETGITEVVYQPAGADLERELATFIEAATG